MRTLKETTARANLFKLIDQVGEAHQPIQITGRRYSAVLVSEEDFKAMQETLRVVSVPGMKESLLKGRRAPLKRYSTMRPW